MTAAPALDGARAALRGKVRAARAKAGRRVFPCPALRDEPVDFARDVLGFEPWDLQAEWMAAMALEGAAASIASGHKVGKSSGAAAIALWFWATRRRARVVLMAPKIEHVEIVLWPEVRRLYLGAGRCADCRAKITDDSPIAPPCEFCSPLGDPRWIGADPTKGLKAPDGREIFAYTAREADAIGGISGPELAFIFDEASGIPDRVWEAMKGNEAGGARKLLLGNPLRTSGEFFDSHHGGKKFWTYVKRISSEETPNARSGEKLVPGLAERSWIEKRAEEWGRDSVIYGVRVLGKFPKAEEGQIVGLDVLEAAEQRYESTKAVGRLQVGVDVAFNGDEAAIAPRRGEKILELTALQGIDEETLAVHVMGAVRAHRRSRDQRPLVVYDSNGPGARLGKALKRYADEIDCIGINGTAKPRRPREFLQLRDEVACNFADWLKAGGAIPSDGKLEGEIIATKAFDSGGRRRVISNDELKKILKRSPDRRNACELAVWEPTGASEPDDGEEDAPPPPAAKVARAARARDDDDDTFAGDALDPYASRGIDPYGGAS